MYKKVYSSILFICIFKYAYENFFTSLNDNINTAFPEINIKYVNKSIPLNPWFTPALLISRKVKIKLSSLKIRKPTVDNINKYKKYLSIYNKTLRKSKQNYYHTKFTEYSYDLRRTWDTIREVLGRNKNKVNIPDFFRSNGKIIT